MTQEDLMRMSDEQVLDKMSVISDQYEQYMSENIQPDNQLEDLLEQLEAEVQRRKLL